MESKQAVAFLKKSSAKNFCYPRLLSGQSLPVQQPWVAKVFWLLFFKKATASFAKRPAVGVAQKTVLSAARLQA
jgi:hypothetical protein